MSDEVIVQVTVPEIVVQPQVASITVQQVGAQGAVGPQGPAGVYVSATPPVNTNLIWVDTTAL